MKEHSLTCIDLFAGCGGLGLGLQLSGFTPLLFSELNETAAKTYLANHPSVPWESDIYQLTDEKLDAYMSGWSRQVDLICGGPPCQGFSSIGHRRSFSVTKEEMPGNHLYLEMGRVISKVRPKAFLFENVRGLLSGKWGPEGEQGEIFRDVRRYFDSIPGYVVRWELVHAKRYGVPQNRPRLLMVGMQEGLTSVRGPVPDLPTAIIDGFLPAPDGLLPPNPEEALSDLVDEPMILSRPTTAYPSPPANDFQTRMRTRPDGTVAGVGEQVTEQEYSAHAQRIVDKYDHMLKNAGEIPEHARTKKFFEKVLPARWGPNGPNITVACSTNDLIHFCQPRNLTVREYARLQTFPDWYAFVGPRTTGGRRRAGDPSKGIWTRDVPKYTQIGNAVPVELARRMGVHLAKLLAL